jgi:hypothetical protein
LTLGSTEVKVRVLRHQPLNLPTLFPPPGGRKLKKLKQSTVHQTKMACCTVFFAIIQFMTTFGGLRKDIGQATGWGRRHFSLKPIGLSQWELDHIFMP